MKILKLGGMKVSPMVAVIHRHKEKSYYNIKHGSAGKNLHVLSYGIDNKLYNPDNALSPNPLVLNGNNYILKTVNKKGDILRDVKDNIIYTVSTDNVENHLNDIVLFWEIPINKYKDITYTTTGDVTTLGAGIIGKERGTETTQAPAPVLEIYGSCVLTLEGLTPDNKKVKQVITVTKDANDHLEFDIPPFTTTPHTNEGS